MMKKMLYYTSDENNTDEMKDEGKESEKRIFISRLRPDQTHPACGLNRVKV